MKMHFLTWRSAYFDSSFSEIQKVRCRYSNVIFLQKETPHIAREGEVWGVFFSSISFPFQWMTPGFASRAFSNTTLACVNGHITKYSGIAWLCAFSLLAHSNSKRQIRLSIFYIEGYMKLGQYGKRHIDIRQSGYPCKYSRFTISVKSIDKMLCVIFCDLIHCYLAYTVDGTAAADAPKTKLTLGSWASSLQRWPMMMIYIYIYMYACVLPTWFYIHDDVIKWKHFPRHWSYRSPVNSPHKG